MNNVLPKVLGSEYNIVYRVNINTAEFEVLRVIMENPEFVYGYKDFYELEEDYYVNGVEKEFVGEFIHSEGMPSNYPVSLRLKYIREYFDNNDETLVGYYLERKGRWLKLVITKEEGFSKEQPYIIYAITECLEEIKEKTRNIIYNTAITKMYSMVIALDFESFNYYNIHCDEELGLDYGSGSMEQFIDFMRKQVIPDDFIIIEELVTTLKSKEVDLIEREYRIEDKNGVIHHMSGFATNIVLPEGERMLFLVRNIDERVASRIRLKNLNAKYDKTKNALFALGSSYFGIYYANLETKKITTIRRGDDVRTIFDERLHLDEIFDKYISTIVHREYRDELARFVDVDRIREVLTSKGQRIIMEYQRSFGTVFKWVRVVFQATKCVDGKAVNVIMAFKDITEEKELEFKNQQELNNALIEAKLASEAKSRFLANMSHDIRTPMNAIMGMTSIALAHSDNSEKVEECLRNIDISANHLIKLINDILDMSYIESGRFTLKNENFNILELIDTVMLISKEQFESRKQTFKLHIGNLQNTKLCADRLRIQQIIINVLENASKYTPNVGMVEMTVSQEATYEDYAVYRIEIKDTGIGMSEEFLEKIFTPFERENNEAYISGNGLGMSIVKHILELMEGDISISSVQNKGTKFVITIPMKFQMEDVPNEIQGEKDYSILKGKKILVVDDNEINCTIACDYLEDMGVLTEVAINGKEAYNMISTGERYDAVLMDVRMPIMDGYEATDMIRKLDNDYARKLIIIAITANAFEEDVQKSYNAGMNYHISKPINPKMLYDVLVELMQKTNDIEEQEGEMYE